MWSPRFSPPGPFHRYSCQWTQLHKAKESMLLTKRHLSNYRTTSRVPERNTIRMNSSTFIIELRTRANPMPSTEVGEEKHPPQVDVLRLWCAETTHQQALQYAWYPSYPKDPWYLSSWHLKNPQHTQYSEMEPWTEVEGVEGGTRQDSCLICLKLLLGWVWAVGGNHSPRGIPEALEHPTARGCR